MYVHVIGWETAKKDKIDLEGSRLKEKQGLYTCPPSGPQQLPFHCCLEVKEEQIKVRFRRLGSHSVTCVRFAAVVAAIAQSPAELSCGAVRGSY